jgi:hypothetical protein
MKVFRKIKLVTVFIALLPLFNSCKTPSYISTGVHYANPLWAPSYFNGVRYYYLPDIEVYYDLSEQEFVYLDNGQWLFSPVLPPVFSSYDLYNGFVISLNLSVYQPWMHHQYYVSHYPRFYYHNIYHGTDITSIRGFNETERKPIYWKQEDRNRINDLRKNDKMERKAEVRKEPQKTNYYGKGIGQPVKVRPQMKEKKPGKGRVRP